MSHSGDAAVTREENHFGADGCKGRNCSRVPGLASNVNVTPIFRELQLLSCYDRNRKGTRTVSLACA